MPTRPPAVSGSCRLLPAAVLALLPFDAGKPVVQVAVDGRLLHLQVDTGAETSVLTPPGAAALGISPGPARMRVAGLGGAAGYGSVSVPRIDFAGQVLRQMTLPVMRLEGADGLDGLIGADLLAHYEVEIDLRARRITLFRAYGCTHPAPRWRAEAALWIPGAALPILTGWLDGRPLRVLLDTGANVSSVDARMAGLPKAELNADPASRSYGAGGLSIAGHAHRFARLDIGGVSLAQPNLRVIWLPPGLGIDLVMGMDLLAGRRLWLDYAGRRVFIEALPGT